MAKEITGRFSKEKIEPFEYVGEEIRVIVTDRPKGEAVIEALRATAGAWKATHDPEELKRNIYSDRFIST